MFTKLYSFSGPEHSHQLVHLLEHLIIQSFLARLQSIGQDAVLFGVVQSKTIDNQLFIRLSAYSRQVATLFQEHIANLPSFEIEQIHRSLSQIGIETNAIVTIKDRSLLYKQLTYLVRSLKQGIEIDSAPGQALFVRANDGAYRDMLLELSAENLTLYERELFMLFYPLITDIIRWGVIEGVAAYPTSSPNLSSLPQAILCTWPLRLGNTLTPDTFVESTRTHLRHFKAAWYQKQIKAYGAMMSSENTVYDQTARYYEQTGIVIEPATIAPRVTPENLQRVIDALRITAIDA